MLSDAEAIASQVPTVAGIAPQIQLRELISYRDQNTNSLIMGVTPDFLTIRSFDVAKGRFYQ